MIHFETIDGLTKQDCIDKYNIYRINKVNIQISPPYKDVKKDRWLINVIHFKSHSTNMADIFNATFRN
jgi:hypothetical protein